MKRLKKEYLLKRFLEILPGFVSWNLILFPIWGAFICPWVVAYFILAFDIFWLYKSISLAFFSLVSHFRMEASKRMDWMGEVKMFPDWKKVHHIIVICTYKEPIHILERTLESIVNQTLPKEQISVVLGFEAREAGWQEKAKQLKEKFGKKFANWLTSEHVLVPGETAGKHSNARTAILLAKEKLIDTGKVLADYCVVTSCDADHVYHPFHFAYLTFKFLDSPCRFERFWQPAIVFYNNYWRLPAISRVSNTFATAWNIAQLSRTDRLINQQNYSLSYRLLEKIGFWDPDVIPEDWHMFFKAFFKSGGKVEVEPIYLPLYADAAESTTLLKTVKNQYEQFKRWAWGVSDDPYVIKNYFISKEVPFWDKTLRTIRLVLDHFLWPVNWFVITLGVNLPVLVNRNFYSRTAIGFNLPRVSSAILSLCLFFMAIDLWVDAKQRPPRPEGFPKIRALLLPLEFLLMPVAGFIFTFLPSLDAHTRLMLGKYIEYRVTEKV